MNSTVLGTINYFGLKKCIDVTKSENNLSIYELLEINVFLAYNFFYIALSFYAEFQVKRPIILEIHRPRYALVYNNIIENSILDNNYYKIFENDIL